MSTMTTTQLRAALLRAIDYSNALEVLARAGVQIGREVEAANDRIRLLAVEIQRRRRENAGPGPTPRHS